MIVYKFLKELYFIHLGILNALQIMCNIMTFNKCLSNLGEARHSRQKEEHQHNTDMKECRTWISTNISENWLLKNVHQSEWQELR